MSTRFESVSRRWNRGGGVFWRLPSGMDGFDLLAWPAIPASAFCNFDGRDINVPAMIPTSRRRKKGGSKDPMEVRTIGFIMTMISLGVRF